MNSSAFKMPWPGWGIVNHIGSGSFGNVYEIKLSNIESEERAAVKVSSIPKSSSDYDEMLSQGYDDESISTALNQYLSDIVNEYLIMRKMHGCPNVVNCEDVSYEPRTDVIGWNIYVKMELLTPLIKALPAQIPEETVIKIAKDLCNALVACKDHNIIHRDIKPQIVFVSDDGIYKLGDFGIAKIIEKTANGTKIGTYKYMAPEVYYYKPYGESVDIYSLGLVLYWLLNNRRLPFLPPFPQKISISMEEEAKQRRMSGERIPEPVNGSKELKRIIMKACAYNQKNRYSTASDMLADLNSIDLSIKTDDVVEVAPIEESSACDSCEKERKRTEKLPKKQVNEWIGNIIKDQPKKKPISKPEDRTKPETKKSDEKSKTEKEKQMLMFLILCPLTGILGVHEFYKGNTILGIIKCVSEDFFMFGCFFDVGLLLMGKCKDKGGNYIKVFDCQKKEKRDKNYESKL